MEFSYTEGISLRDYFAAAAMQGAIAKEGYASDFAKNAKLAYQVADAMLEARKHNKKENLK